MPADGAKKRQPRPVRVVVPVPSDVATPQAAPQDISLHEFRDLIVELKGTPAPPSVREMTGKSGRARIRAVR